MNTELLEHIRDQLKHSDAIQSGAEFCRAWLGSDEGDHREWVQLFDGLKLLCDSAIGVQSQSIWRAPERMAS
jgi:hypothetical protein